MGAKFRHTLIATVLMLSAVVSISTAQPVDPRTLPRVQSGDLAYIGSFTLPATDGTGRADTVGGLTYGGFGLGLGADGASLYVGCHAYSGAVSRVTIPAIGGVASIVEPCASVPNLHAINPTDPNRKYPGGTLWWNRLIVSAYSTYDGSGSATASHFAGASVAGLSGPYRVGTENPGFVGGFMGIVPTEWRALLGGPALTGQCCISIISRTSYGPSVSVFDPAALAARTPATLLVGYPGDHQAFGSPDEQNPNFTWATRMGGIAFPAGTRSVLFIGRHGGTSCYGQGTANQALDQQPVPGATGVRYCYDPIDLEKGTHGYPYVHQVWAYDAGDMADVKAGAKAAWDVRPYAVWTLPGMNSTGGATISSATYDPTARRIYMMQDTGGGVPRVHVYSVGATAPPPAQTNCIPGTESMVSDDSAAAACVNGSKLITEQWTRTGDIPATNGGAACAPVVSPRTHVETCTPPPIDQCRVNPITLTVASWTNIAEGSRSQGYTWAVANVIVTLKKLTVEVTNGRASSVTLIDSRDCSATVTR